MKIHTEVLPARRRLTHARRTAVLAAACGLLLARPAAAASPDANAAAHPKREIVTSELIAGRQKDAQQAKDLDDATRAKILDTYRRAAEALKSAATHAERSAEMKRLTEQAAHFADKAKEELKQVREELARLGTTAVTPEAQNRSPGALESELATARLSLETLRKQQADLERVPNHRANRRKEIRALLLAAPAQNTELKKQLAAVPPDGEPAALTLARRTLLRAQLQAADRELPALQAELARYDVEDSIDLVRHRRDLVAQKIAVEERRVKLTTELLDSARRAEADRAVAEARRRQVATHPLLRSYAQENTLLAEEAQRLTKPIETAENDLKQSTAALETLTKQFRQTRQKAENVGLTGLVGQLLRMQRAALADPLAYQRSVDARSQAIDEVQFRLYELDEIRSSIANPQPIIQTILTQAPPDLGADERRVLEKASAEVLEAKQGYLDALSRSYSKYYDTLLELVATQHKLIDELKSYADYIDTRVLWIRSSRPLALRDLFRGKPLLWLVSPSNWSKVGRSLAADTVRRPVAPLGLILLGALFWYIRRRFNHEIGKLGQDAHRSNFTRFMPTLRAFALTVLTSASGAAIGCYLGWRLSAAAYEEDFPGAVSVALFSASWLFFPLDVIRRTCRRDGLAEAHFGWSTGAVRAIGRDVRWLMGVGIPLTFVSVMLHESDADSLRNALERLLFAAGMAAIAVFAYRVLRPHTGIVRELAPSQHDEWSERVQQICRWTGVVAGAAIAALVVAGYDYTARQFVWRIYLTAVGLVCAYYTRALLLRWILIHRRLMGMRQVKERRVTELRSTVQADASVVAPVHAEHLPKVDLAALSEQTSTLVNVGILSALFVSSWFIWLDLFPSMGALNRWVLWTTLAGDHEAPITAANLVSALLIAGLTWIAVRNIPGLLEMTVLQRLPLDNAGRLAFSTLARYAIVIVGLVSASSTVGIGWSKVQWLATALTFGLAFGLQEIFANFIAGLIILFERPVRVGDMVTIDDVTGVVNRIRIRATTLTNSDHKEFIVPNKEFITGRVLNWTLSDTINRIVINVGIAYGSDTDLARELLLKAAHDHPAVLRDPGPTASFEEFGDTSLKLVLRCFLPNLTERTRVIHELHTAINGAFASHGITIPVPVHNLTGRPASLAARKFDALDQPHPEPEAA